MDDLTFILNMDDLTFRVRVISLSIGKLSLW
jgi:hypothetical protein